MDEKCCTFVLPVHYAREKVRCIQQLNCCECRWECSANGPQSCRDVNAARNILHRLVAVAGWVIGSKSRPGASESVLEDNRAGLPDKDAERYTAEGFQSCI